MSAIDELNAAVAKLKEDVAAQTTIEDSVLKLLTDSLALQKTLSEQLAAALAANEAAANDPAIIEAAKAISDANSIMEQNAQKLAAAVPQNVVG